MRRTTEILFEKIVDTETGDCIFRVSSRFGIVGTVPDRHVLYDGHFFEAAARTNRRGVAAAYNDAYNAISVPERTPARREPQR